MSGNIRSASVALVALWCTALAPESLAAEGTRLSCLSAKDMRQAISERKLVDAAEALRVARTATPGDVVRIRLCQADGDDLIYQVTIVKRDGRVQRVTIDADSGKVASVR